MSTDVCALTVYALRKPCMYVFRYCVDSHNIQQSRVNGGRLFRAIPDDLKSSGRLTVSCLHAILALNKT